VRSLVYFSRDARGDEASVSRDSDRSAIRNGSIREHARIPGLSP